MFFQQRGNAPSQGGKDSLEAQGSGRLGTTDYPGDAHSHGPWEGLLGHSSLPNWTQLWIKL